MWWQKLYIKLRERHEWREYTTANNSIIQCETLCTNLKEGRDRHESTIFSPMTSGACSGRLAALLWSRCPSVISLTLGYIFFFCVAQFLLWGSPFWGEIFAHVTFFNPTIEVITFCLRGWCMLGVFFLPAFTCLGHECQDLLSLCNGMQVSTD